MDIERVKEDLKPAGFTGASTAVMGTAGGRLARVAHAREGPAGPAMSDLESSANKKLIVVGDRVLIAPEEGEERTRVGLYLPQTAIDTLAVQGGRVLATGPGTPLTEPAAM